MLSYYYCLQHVDISNKGEHLHPNKLDANAVSDGAAGGV